MIPESNWLLLIGGVVYVFALHAETKIKTAHKLMGLDAHLAPNWYFGGLYKKSLQLFSTFGGIAGAALMTSNWWHFVGWWSSVIFLGLLYLKYAIATWRSLRLAMRAIPPGWKSPLI